MSRERGQALVEAVAAFPVCIACALVLVDAGVLVRDRVAVAQAATRAAEAQLNGHVELLDAAAGALPARIRSSAVVTRRGNRITVTASSTAPALGVVGVTIEQRSSVEVPA